jgi:polynucleotide 5'-hydroxyl-kinase GRC3/NOL9
MNKPPIMLPGDQDPGHLEHFPFLARIEVLPEWDEAARRFLGLGGVAMVLGAPDTGKSTLSRYLVYRAYCRGQPVALVDLDLGQSHLGPPATLGLGLFPPRLPGEEGLSPEGLYFIGQTSPLGATLEVAVGCRALMDLAARRGVTRVVVNTSGWVQGLPAQRLKRAQVELLQPSLILALEREQELAPLLRALGCGTSLGDSLSSETPPLLGEGNNEISGWPVIRLPVSSRVTLRSPEERRRYREERFRRYFQGARKITLPWRSLVWEGLPWGQGEPLGAAALEQFHRDLGVKVLHGESRGRGAVLLLAEPPPPHLHLSLPEEGRGPVQWLSWPALHFRLVGLLDAAHRSLALGLILPSHWDPEALALWTPLPPASAPRVRFLKVGKMKVSLEGRELPYM